MKKPEWYTKAQDYWNGVTPTVDGMLGGFSVVDPVDVKGSLEFVDEFVHGKRGVNNVMKTEPVITNGYACDCGAGIGRVTRNFLLQVPFEKVDLVEQAPSFVEQAKASYLKQEIEQGKVGQVLCQGLQDFEPEQGKYDLIWCQWVLGHLTDGKSKDQHLSVDRKPNTNNLFRSFCCLFQALYSRIKTQWSHWCQGEQCFKRSIGRRRGQQHHKDQR